ncbi:MAG: TonB-dependent receptor [Prevotellaceae bacterium]|jgi:TonB-linked SusC/RagA family outer membrane protein|nr:TonB-dependent receptor [Prevotellaceae bacterium]
MKKLFCVLILSALSIAGYAQNRQVSGVVVDPAGAPVVGASVLAKGTTTGTLTDPEGRFTMYVPESVTSLAVRYIGYVEAEAPVGTNIRIVLQADEKAIDEVVVMGYGVQKKKLVTGATVQVGGDDLQKLSTISPLTAMQSQTPGVHILQSSGQPGESFKINIRGIGTTGNYQPLFVIDGVAGGNIDNLNPSDIESIDVLKDAASAAIYGARAANGVVLITTRQGRLGAERMSVSYDGYLGWQNVYKMASPLNAKQYMNIVDEGQFNIGASPYKWEDFLGGDFNGKTLYEMIQSGEWEGTNWLDEIRNVNAPMQNHAINVTGGGNRSNFSMGFSYTSQEGIFGKPVQSTYDRYTFRLNSNHTILKHKNLDIIKVGETLFYMQNSRQGIGIGSHYWNDISNMLRAAPFMPVYGSDGKYFDADDKEATGMNGYFPAIVNPIGDMVYRRGSNLSKNHFMMASAHVEIQPVKNFVFRSQFGYMFSANSYRAFTPVFKLGPASAENTENDVSQNGGMGFNYTWENTLNYKFSASEHHVDVLLGQSLEKSGFGESWGATNVNSSFDDFEHAWLDNTAAASATTTVSGSPWGQGALASFFGRINYDYKETYMLSLVMRADGSSNFARGHRWGYFPSVSAGWLLTNESFMDGATQYVDFLKLRGSWGQNGNSNIPNFQYMATVALDQFAGYSFGNDKDGVTKGGYANVLPNVEVTWETSEQLDLGFDARFLRSRLSLAFDYYQKTTKDWLIQAPILAAYGNNAPYINGGDVQNRGVELALSWNDNIAQDFRYSAGVNFAYNENEVLRIANSEGIIHGTASGLFQGAEEMYRAQVGFPIGYFYGYKSEGVFQNQADIDAWRAAGKGFLQDNPVPGDLKFSDLQPDGKIDEDDKGMIGDPHPDVTLGVNLSLSYRGLDLGLSAYGSFGQQIAKSYQKGDNIYENYTTEVYNRWYGEGTSNERPRLMGGNTVNYINVSDIYLEDGDFLKLSNITLGYDFKQLFKRLPFEQLRFYVTAQNLYTFTGYSGMDPEIGYSPGEAWVSGIDLGYYPNPRTWLVGVNVKF